MFRKGLIKQQNFVPTESIETPLIDWGSNDDLWI